MLTPAAAHHGTAVQYFRMLHTQLVWTGDEPPDHPEPLSDPTPLTNEDEEDGQDEPDFEESDEEE